MTQCAMLTFKHEAPLGHSGFPYDRTNIPRGKKNCFLLFLHFFPDMLAHIGVSDNQARTSARIRTKRTGAGQKTYSTTLHNEIKAMLQHQREERMRHDLHNAAEARLSWIVRVMYSFGCMSEHEFETLKDESLRYLTQSTSFIS